MSWFLIKSVLNISQTGFVDVEKVKDITLNLGDGMNEHDVDKLMNVGDDDQDGTMSYAEIMNIIENNKAAAMFAPARGNGMGMQNLRKRCADEDKTVERMVIIRWLSKVQSQRYSGATSTQSL